MDAPHQLVADLVALLLAAALLGIIVTGRLWLCRSFGLYLAVTLLTNRLVSWWPGRFFNLGFFTLKEGLHALLVVVVAAELAVTAFMAFPRAQRVALRGVLAVVAVAALTVAVAPTSTYVDWMGSVVPRMVLGAGWSLVVVLLVAYWYRLPLTPWHWMLIVGFVLDFGLYGALLAAIGHYGLGMYPYLSALNPTAYAASVGLWVFAAWRASPEGAGSKMKGAFGRQSKA